MVPDKINLSGDLQFEPFNVIHAHGRAIQYHFRGARRQSSLWARVYSFSVPVYQSFFGPGQL